MEWKGSEGIVFAAIGLAGLCVTVVFLFVIFQKKKNKLLLKQVEAQKHFEQEIGELQIEIREQILRNISWELHDNIGQLLTLAKIQLQKVEEDPVHIPEINQNLTNILNEVRALSRIINPDYITSINLYEAIKLETDRFNRLKYIEAAVHVQGQQQDLNPKAEVVIFRILQEFFSNTIKHSRATKLDVNLVFEDQKLTITATDNGVGFDSSKDSKNGIGLDNMKRRGALINATVELQSEPKKGTLLRLIHLLHK